jgi:hypothetical protein
MFWQNLVAKLGFRQAKKTPSAAADILEPANSPIRGFTVLSMSYRNHIHPDIPPVSNHDLALRLSYDLDRAFLNDPELKHLSCGKPYQGSGENEDAFAFYFGQYDRSAEDYITSYTIIVRETAGGGFMLLIENTAMAFADTTRALFTLIADDLERQNPAVTADEN